MIGKRAFLEDYAAVEMLNSADMAKCVRVVVSQSLEITDAEATIKKYQGELTEKDALLVKTAEDLGEMTGDRDKWKGKAKGRGDRTLLWFGLGGIAGLLIGTR